MTVAYLESAVHACYNTIAEARVKDEKLKNVMTHLIFQSFSELRQESHIKIRDLVVERIEEPLRQEYVRMLSELYNKAMADFTINELKDLVKNPKHPHDCFVSIYGVHRKMQEIEDSFIKNNDEAIITSALKRFGGNYIREQGLQTEVSYLVRSERVKQFSTMIAATPTKEAKKLTFSCVLNNGDFESIKKAIQSIDPELIIPDSVKDLLQLLNHFVQEEDLSWLRILCEEVYIDFKVQIQGKEYPTSYSRKEFVFEVLKRAVDHNKLNILINIYRHLKSYIPERSENLEGGTILHWAAKKGQLPIVQYLVNTIRLDPNSRVEAERYDVFTPLSLAIDNEHWDVATFLVQNGVDCKFGVVPNLKKATRCGQFDFLELVVKKMNNLFRVPDVWKKELLKDCLEIAKENEDEKLIRLWTNLNELNLIKI